MQFLVMPIYLVFHGPYEIFDSFMFSWYFIYSFRNSLYIESIYFWLVYFWPSLSYSKQNKPILLLGISIILPNKSYLTILECVVFFSIPFISRKDKNRTDNGMGHQILLCRDIRLLCCELTFKSSIFCQIAMPKYYL